MSEDEKIPVAVVGAGNMGSNHIRVYDELPEAELVEVVENDPERAAEVQEKYDVDVVNSVNVLEKCEAATIAIPNRLHREVSIGCIERGIDILVEKPLSETVDEANEIVEAARENDVLLQVGHIERFNPAVETLREILEEQEIIALEAHRLGPFNEQLSGESVVFDLMVHDIDIINSIVNSEPHRINAVGSQAKSDKLDHIFSQFEFRNGVIASATASHVTHGKVRTLDVTTSDAYISLDYQKQNINVQRRGVEETKTTNLLGRSGYRTETVTENPYIKRSEPLKGELEHFLTSVREREKPNVGGEEGLEAVRIARAIVEDIKNTA